MWWEFTDFKQFNKIIMHLMKCLRLTKLIREKFQLSCKNESVK